MNSYEAPQTGYADRFDLKNAITGALPGDAPLLYELGINLKLIRAESLLPVRVLSAKPGQPLIGDEGDLTGPILTLALFTAFLILHGKIHFGYIYLMSLFSCASVYALLNLLQPMPIGAVLCSSVLGYSMGPVVVYAVAALGLRRVAPVLLGAVGVLAAAWSAYTAATVFCTHLGAKNRGAVVGIPLFLVYMSFVLMVQF
ncbi:protein YIPF5/7 [Pancytospora philotis]|nr:protein YIPF5/7 [Pancytospora philotis]